MSEPENLLSEWARVLIGSLARAGVRDVVSSPGSRSTPFLWAALQAEGLDVTTIADERSAAFFALGRAKLSGMPTLLLCTSGSAAGHYLPAVIEASESFTPLLVLSADRPFCLQGAGAHQTVDQSRIFGGFTREFIELGDPDASDGALEALSRRAAQAVFRSRFPTPGPVQLNARARKPLEPRFAANELSARADAALAHVTCVSVPRLSVDAQAIDELAEACLRSERPFVVCGPLSPAEPPVRAAALAHAIGAPLCPEATSQVRFALDAPGGVVRCDAAEKVLPTAPGPDLILQIGALPVSAAWERYTHAHPGARRFIIAAHGWPDPESRAERLLVGRPGAIVDALLERVPRRAPNEIWLRSFSTANAQAWREIERALGDGFSGGAVARAVVEALPDGALLALGNSLPVRDVDRSCPAGSRGLAVLSQRGTAGIDGLISSAAGAAAVSGRPTALLIGDVSFLHDVGGLWAAREVKSPLAIVVVNNGGGRIFDELPLAGSVRDAERFRHWRTPHDFDLAHAAALYGHPFERAKSRAELDQALERSLERAGTTVIEAR